MTISSIQILQHMAWEESLGTQTDRENEAIDVNRCIKLYIRRFIWGEGHGACLPLGGGAWGLPPFGGGAWGLPPFGGGAWGLPPLKKIKLSFLITY